MGVAVVLAILSLLPWWRNRACPHDFHDYGPVIEGVGRVDGGERPYRDFATPLRTGAFLVNGLAETVFGSTYRGLTWGAFVAIPVGFGLFAAMLARRFGMAAALPVGAGLTWATHAQHTIVWHDAAGVLLLAMVAWSSALAPIWRREDRGWHIVLGIGLFLGGLNKIGFQVVALAFALGWAWRAHVRRQATLREAVWTSAAILVCGVVLPAAFELLWTGASPGDWWRGVEAWSEEGRAADLSSIFTLKFLLPAVAGDRGPIVLSLLGMLLTLVVAGVGLLNMRGPGLRANCALLVVAVLFALVGGIGLMGTTGGIAWVAFAGWLVLLVSLWLGFALPTHGVLPRLVLVVPTVVVGLLAWEAAWSGRRTVSFDPAAERSVHRSGVEAGSAFAYLRGTRVSPDLAKSLANLAVWRSALPEAEHAAVFYGNGTEWLERVWPSSKAFGRPLTFPRGAGDPSTLESFLGAEGVYRHVLFSTARGSMDAVDDEILRRSHALRLIGPVLRAYSRMISEAVSVHPLEFVGAYGGNIDSSHLASRMGPHLALDGRRFLGVRTGRGEMTLLAPSYRLRGEAVLRRLPGTPPGELTADFAIAALRENETPIDLWIERHTLPAGEMERVVPFEIGGGGMPVRFEVTVMPDSADRLVAGWRNPTIQHAMETSEEPPRLHHTTLDSLELDEESQRLLLPEGSTWRARRMIARGGRLTPDGLELAPGGELWVRLERPVSVFVGEGRLAARGDSREPPLLRAFYYKGARLEITSQESTGEEGRLGFRVWSAEPDGWLALSVAPDPRAASLAVRITEVRE